MNRIEFEIKTDYDTKNEMAGKLQIVQYASIKTTEGLIQQMIA